mgnify:CR=1 FL=1
MRQSGVRTMQVSDMIGHERANPTVTGAQALIGGGNLPANRTTGGAAADTLHGWNAGPYVLSEPHPVFISAFNGSGLADTMRATAGADRL